MGLCEITTKTKKKRCCLSTTLSFFLFFALETGNQIYQPLLSLNAKDELKKRIELIQRNVKNLLRIAKQDAWVCDPNKKQNS